MATPADVRALFEAKLKEGIPNPPGAFHPSDLERVKDDKYLARILHHQENDAVQSCEMLWNILVWRKTVNANDLNENTVKLDYLTEGAVFPHGRDIDGHLMLVIKSKLHVKGQKDFEELKKCIIYWFDRIEREENGKAITFFFDMDSCGLSNMDLDLIKYLILLMKEYYPLFLHYIIIFQMPWILNAAFKVVKSLLPAKAIEKMKFTSRENLSDFVPPDQALICWGGKNDYVFEFIPENRSAEIATKKVTFAEQGDQHSPGEMLRILPGDTITFENKNDELSSQFTITNMDESVVSFKIRTTSPEKFKVRPSSGVLLNGASQTIRINVLTGFQMHTKDRFLVMSVQIPSADLTTKEMADVWQKSSGSKVDEYRLKCNYPEKELPKNGLVPEQKSLEKSEFATTLLAMQQNYELLQRNVKHLKIFQIMTFFLTFIIALLGFLLYQKYESNGYCSKM